MVLSLKLGNGYALKTVRLAGLEGILVGHLQARAYRRFGDPSEAIGRSGYRASVGYLTVPRECWHWRRHRRQWQLSNDAGSVDKRAAHVASSDIPVSGSIERRLGKGT